MSGPEDFRIGGFEIVDPHEPVEPRSRPPAASPYAVPLSTLIAGAYVGATDRTEVHPEPLPPGMSDVVEFGGLDAAGPVGFDGAGFDGGGFDGGGGQ